MADGEGMSTSLRSSGVAAASGRVIGTGGASEERFSLVVGASASGSSYVLGSRSLVGLSHPAEEFFVHLFGGFDSDDVRGIRLHGFGIAYEATRRLVAVKFEGDVDAIFGRGANDGEARRS
jgi:hypothetical protein